MKGNSGTKPNKFEKSAGKIQFRYNIIETVHENDDGTTSPTWNYDYVEVEKTDKKSLTRAMIKDKYDIEDEIAIINDFNAGKDITKHVEYQKYRDSVKLEVSEYKKKMK